MEVIQLPKVIQLPEKTVSQAVLKIIELKGKWTSQSRKKRKELILEIFELCEYNPNILNKAIKAVGYNKFYQYVSNLNLKEEIKKRRKEFTIRRSLEIARNENVNSVANIAEMFNIDLKTLKSRIDNKTLQEIKKILKQKKIKNKMVTVRLWEEAIIESYGNIDEAREKLKIKGKYSNNQVKKLGVDVDKARETGRMKLKNDLMFVLKMTGYNQTQTAKILSVNRQSISIWIKKFGITKKTIEKYHAPFALVPVKKVIDHDEIPIKNGKIKLNNWNWWISLKLKQARDIVIYSRAHPDKGGSQERFTRALNNLRRIQKFDADVRKRYNLPSRKSSGKMRIPRKGIKPPNRWETLKFKKPKFPIRRRK